jgi:hypothetical protein
MKPRCSCPIMNYPQGYSPEPDEVSADVNGERSFATLRQRTQQTVLRSAKEEGPPPEPAPRESFEGEADHEVRRC